MTTIAGWQVVPRVRPLVCATEAPDFFSMIDQQAGMVVKLARAVGEVLQGKESTHALRLLDLEQRREELQRRNQAAVHSLQRAALDEIRSTMDALDRAAAGLFRTARDCHPGWSPPEQTASQMMAVIQNAVESLQQGYARLATGSPAAECDADAAIASTRALGMTSGCGYWRNELYGNLDEIAHELSGAGVILKRWSRQLSGAGADTCARLSQQFLAS